MIGLKLKWEILFLRWVNLIFKPTVNFIASNFFSGNVGATGPRGAKGKL